MISFLEPALALAVQLEVGHPEPFSPDEIAGVRRLIVHAASDLHELNRFPALEDLDLFACEGRIDAAFPALWRLRVSCSRVGEADYIDQMPLLEEAEFGWSEMTDLAALLRHPRLARGSVLGLPLSEAAWSEQLPELLERRFGKGRRASWAALSADDHALNRALRADGVAVCFGHMDARFPILVRPGLPTSKRIGVDYVLATPDAIRDVPREPGVSTADWMKALVRVAYGKSPRPSTNLRPAREMGDATVAQGWISRAKFDDVLKVSYASFVHRFRELPFFRESPGMSSLDAQRHRARLPSWLVAGRGTVAGVSPHLSERAVTWILQDVDGLFPGVNGSGEQRFAFGLFGAWIPAHQGVLEQGWFCVGYRTEGRPVVLVAKLADDLDRRVYAYDPTTVVSGRLPHPPAPVLAHWGVLLDRIFAVDLPGQGRVVGARG